jgi:plastocyanin
MRPEVRDRFVLPILLPVGILVVIGGVLFGFSRVLLGVEGTGATTTALIVAASIVVAAAVAVSRSQVRGSTVFAMAGAVAGVAMLSGGVALALVAGGEETGGEGPGHGGAVVQLTAQNLAFQPTALTVPAGQPFTIAFSNKDAGVQHNVAIFPGKETKGEPVFEGDLVTGVATADYQVPALDAGTYAFHCVVHPTMVGTIEAVEGGGGGGPSLTVTAKNLSFDTDEIDLPPDTATTLTFDNQDAGVQHNIAIYEDDSLSKALFMGDLVTGPASAEYQIPPLPAGEYYFHCDVHPTMNGTVVVGGPAGGGSGPTGGGGGASGPTGAATGSTGGGGGSSATAQPASITAQNLSFDTQTITLPASKQATITFRNEDAGVQHNLAIYTDESLSQNLFRGDLVTGPDSVEYTIPPLDPGQYYFHCDVHPTMNGTVTVS